MEVINLTNDLRKIINEKKKEGLTVGLVPTMGALHDGHKSLIEKARKTCDVVVVSIFVNPIQFGENEDFDKYPRNFENDKKVCLDAGCDIIFKPEYEEMYPEYKSSSKNVKDLTYIVKVPQKFTDKLCGKTRIGHFDGVATVVLKLFNLVKPDFAFFGQKDIQQFIILKNMIESLNLDINIQMCPIIREPSGLARSSRNTYLSDENKQKASSINKMLINIKTLFEKGENDKLSVFSKSKNFLDKAIEIEYIECCKLNNLDISEKLEDNTFVAIACKIAGVRLIDNIIL
jgi:pantoate--beta-alanine ligase